MDKLLDDLPWSRRLHEHPEPKTQISAATAIASMDLAKVESKGDTLKNLVRGLMYMISGKTSSADYTRQLAQARAARALAWICYLDEVPGIVLEGAQQGNSDHLSTLSRLLVETHDRAVLVELIALVGWLANASDDYAQLVGSDTDILRTLAEHLAARAPAIQYKAAWALACLARGKNKMRILSGDNHERMMRNLTAILRSNDLQCSQMAARCAGALANGNRANAALMSRQAGGKASNLYLALKACSQSKDKSLRMEAQWAEGVLARSFTEDSVGG